MMIKRNYQQVFYTNSSTSRPFAKLFYDKTADEIVNEWLNNEKVLTQEQSGGIVYGFSYIDEELRQQENLLIDRDLSFTEDMQYSIVRIKTVPKGKSYERFELEILKAKEEVILSPDEESFTNKLKEFRREDYWSKLCVQPYDLFAIANVGESYYYNLECFYDYDHHPDLWKINLGILEPEPVEDSSPYHIYDRFHNAVRTALRNSNTVEDAVSLLNTVLKDSGAGRRLTDEELLSFGIDLEAYHRDWPKCYIGEKGGDYFISLDDCAGVTNGPSGFEEIIDAVINRARTEALFSGSTGLKGCGGVSH